MESAAICGSPLLVPLTIVLLWTGIYLGSLPWRHGAGSQTKCEENNFEAWELPPSEFAADPEHHVTVPSMRSKDWRAAVVVSNAFSLAAGFLSAGLAAWLDQDSEGPGGSASGRISGLGHWSENLLVAVNFFIIPFGLGFLASYFWRDVPEKASHARGCGFQFVNYVFAMLGACLIFGDAAPSLWMAAPMVGFVMAAGVGTGRSFWKQNQFLGVLILPALVMTVIMQAFWPHWYGVPILEGHGAGVGRTLFV